jgi:hypothetical protein
MPLAERLPKTAILTREDIAVLPVCSRNEIERPVWGRPVGEPLLSLPVSGFAGLIIFVARLWFRGAHPSVVSRGAILTILPVCGFAGLTRLWFRGVLLLLFACLWFRGAHLSVVSRGAILTICLSVVLRGHSFSILV